MIYTVTFNPAIDYVVHMDSFMKGDINRAKREDVYFGGKGINVSLMLKELGIPSVAMGFAAGFTGSAIMGGLKNNGVETDFIELDEGCSRINVKVKAEEETAINGQGPMIPRSAIKQLMEKLGKLTKEDTLVLAGSVPRTLPEDIYERILAELQGKGIRFVVDASGKLLVNVLKYKPFLIKPNDEELSEIFGKGFEDEDDLIYHARLLQEKGAENVLVSLAGEGSVLIDNRGVVHKMGIPYGELKNSVGAGDSMVAGFIAGYMEEGDPVHALKLGAACGSATAYSYGLGKISLIRELYEQL